MFNSRRSILAIKNSAFKTVIKKIKKCTSDIEIYDQGFRKLMELILSHISVSVLCWGF